jgi:hypothetical protein
VIFDKARYSEAIANSFEKNWKSRGKLSKSNDAEDIMSLGAYKKDTTKLGMLLSLLL